MASKFQFDWNQIKENIKQEDTKKGKFEKDTRFFSTTKDATGLANVVLRFLPDSEGNPFVKIFNHAFDFSVDGQKRWWIRNCINTFGYEKECPICKKNMELWNSAFESDKAVASKRKRKMQYIANVLIIKNPNDPESEGKVMLFKFGSKIYDKIKQKMFPSEADLLDDDFKSFVPFDLFDGADFMLVQTKQGEFPNYDSSKFSKQKPLLGGDEKKIDATMEKTYLLSEFMADDQFPTNEETLKVLATTLGMVDEEEPKKVSKPKVTKEEDVEEITESNTFEPEVIPEGEIDDDLAFFNSLK